MCESVCVPFVATVSMTASLRPTANSFQTNRYDSAVETNVLRSKNRLCLKVLSTWSNSKIFLNGGGGDLT
jgi:hypothetical protein